MKEICCQDVNGFYLGTTCPKCNKPFRSIIEESKQETSEEIDLEPPIGDFILKNAKSIQRVDGAYYHYSEVCKLLKLQKQQRIIQAQIKILEQHIEHPNKPGYKRSDVLNSIKQLKQELEDE